MRRSVDRTPWPITSFNRAAEEITGISRQEVIGHLCSDVFRSSMCEAECALRETPNSGKPGFIIDADGARLPISVSTAVLKDDQGRLAGGAETFRDMSEVETLRRELEGRHQIGDLVSRSPLMQKVFEVLPAIAASPGEDIPLLAAHFVERFNPKMVVPVDKCRNRLRVRTVI